MSVCVSFCLSTNLTLIISVMAKQNGLFSTKITTQTCTIHRGVWNLPQKFHLELIFKCWTANTALFIDCHSSTWNTDATNHPPTFKILHIYNFIVVSLVSWHSKCTVECNDVIVNIDPDLDQIIPPTKGFFLNQNKTVTNEPSKCTHYLNYII